MTRWWKIRGTAAGLVPIALVVAGLTTQSPAQAASSPPMSTNVLVPGQSLPRCGASETLVPAPGFDPTTASEAQLQAHDFPAPPSDPATRRAWQSYVHMYMTGGATIVGDCAHSAGIPAPTRVPTSSNSSGVSPDSAGCGSGLSWAGYTVAGTHIYTDVESTWVVGAGSGGYGSNNLSYHWIGVGDNPSGISTQSHPLVQGGWSARGDGTLGTWIELYYPGAPSSYGPLSGGLSISSGNTVYLHIAFTTSGTTGFHFIDYTTGKNSYPNVPTYSGRSPNGSADWITESPTAYLPDFGEVTFQQDNADWPGSGWQPLGSLPGRSLFSFKGPNCDQLIQTGSIYTDQFTNTWLAATL